MIEDFNLIYPEKKDNLFENIPVCKENILNLGRNLCSTLKDPSLKNIINEYLELAPGKVNFNFLYYTQIFFSKRRFKHFLSQLRQ